MSGWPIGEISRRSGVSISAIRFYEQKGLLPKAARGANNRRTYGPETLDAMTFIAGCRRANLDLDSIRRLKLEMGGDERACSSASTTLEEAIKHLTAQIAQLQSSRKVLSAAKNICGPQHCSPAVGCNVEVALRELAK